MWLRNQGLREGRRNCKNGDGEPGARAMSNAFCKFQVEAIQWEEKVKILGTSNCRTISTAPENGLMESPAQALCGSQGLQGTMAAS